MRVLVGIAGGTLVVLMLTEIFLAFLLPRRVKRDPRIVRLAFAFGWRPWRRVARLLPAQSRDTMLGIYGPLGLLINLVLWIGSMMLGYACLQWAGGSHLGVPHGSVDFGNDLYFSAATMTTDGPSSLAAHTAFARAIQVIDAGSGLAVLAIVIGYLPSLYQAFSRREATVSQLDARAGSPPSAGRLVLRTTQTGGWAKLGSYLGEWEQWVAELMETHLAYPVLGYFRSQHVNQNWLAAMCTVLDACAFTIAAAPKDSAEPARFTFAIARHAVVDLTYSYRVQPVGEVNRLPDADLRALLRQLREADVHPHVVDNTVAERLRHMRALYEPYVCALTRRLELALPPWLAPESPTDNWRNTDWH
ncbi:MAG TPA: potassium channel family protein [Solirubrobacteraceae bacterium]|nr:potassium channel family protein [Solirubrobacteraceae bacterium]